jgi:hypothetical protein
MNQFFLYWVDMVALVLSLISSVLLVIKVVKKNSLAVRPAAAFFLFFGPAAIAVHMSFHLLENIYRAGIAATEGTFAYNFRFYSLLLLGLVLSYLSVELLQKAFVKCQQRHLGNKDLFKTIGKIVLVSAPTIPLTPIGALPTMACIISLAALPFIYKKKQQSYDIGFKEPVSPLLTEQVV